MPYDTILRHVREVRYKGISGNVQFESNGLRRPSELYVMNLQNNSFVKTGSWGISEGIVTRTLRRNQASDADNLALEGKKLMVVIAEVRPFLMSTYNSHTNTTEYEGYCIDILEKLAHELKFTYEIYPSPDGAFGARINGTWNGLIGELVMKKADMALTALTITSSRESVVDFTVPFMYYTTKMIMKKNVVIKLDFLQFMMPFNTPVWIMVIGCLFAVTVALYILNYYSPYGYKNGEGKGTSTEFNLFNCFWFSIACMLQQGGDNTPKSVSARVLVGFYWFCILTWVSNYTANLAAFFTVKNTQHPIRNLEDALKSDQSLGLIESGSTYAFFKSSRAATHQEAWQKIRESEPPLDDEQGVQWARERNFIFISDGPILDYVAQKKPCDLTTVPCLNTELGLAIAMQDNNPFVEKVSLRILRWRQMGYLDSLQKKWWEVAHECHVQKPTGERIDLRSMAGVYIVLALGLLMSFITLVAEICWHKRSNSGLNQQANSSGVMPINIQPEAMKPEDDKAVPHDK